MRKVIAKEPSVITVKREFLEVRRTGCGKDDTDTVVAQYDYHRKLFVDRYGQEIGLTSKFATQFAGENGSADGTFKELCTLSDFKRLYEETVSDAHVTPKFSKGDRGFVESNSYGYRTKDKHKDSKVVVVERLEGYRQDNTCTKEGEVPLVEPVYLCVDSRDGDEVLIAESKMRPISILEEFIQGKKVVDAVKAKLNREGLVGAVLIYNGKVYEF